MTNIYTVLFILKNRINVSLCAHNTTYFVKLPLWINKVVLYCIIYALTGNTVTIEMLILLDG